MINGTFMDTTDLAFFYGEKWGQWKVLGPVDLRQTCLNTSVPKLSLKVGLFNEKFAESEQQK